MSGCTQTDKPRIAILMAVYEPRIDWLRQQLESLNAQTYPNLMLYVYDDCSPTVPYEEIQSCVQDCISAFPYVILRNEKNLGSNGTFELLTTEAEGEYFAYCDQDDVWLPEKLTVLEEQLSSSEAKLICSDVTPIDARGATIAESITTLRPRHIFRQGSGLAAYLIYRNFVIGCTMLIRREAAKAALPFAENMVHDHYLAFFCAMGGKIVASREHLVYYRIHSGNQTGVLTGVMNRTEYIKRHLLPFCNRVEELQERFELPELVRAFQWAEARKKNAGREPGGIRELWGQRGMNITTTLFEIVGLRLPQPLFRLALRLIQAGRI